MKKVSTAVKRDHITRHAALKPPRAPRSSPMRCPGRGPGRLPARVEPDAGAPRASHAGFISRQIGQRRFHPIDRCRFAISISKMLRCLALVRPLIWLRSSCDTSLTGILARFHSGLFFAGRMCMHRYARIRCAMRRRGQDSEAAASSFRDADWNAVEIRCLPDLELRRIMHEAIAMIRSFQPVSTSRGIHLVKREGACAYSANRTRMMRLINIPHV